MQFNLLILHNYCISWACAWLFYSFNISYRFFYKSFVIIIIRVLGVKDFYKDASFHYFSDNRLIFLNLSSFKFVTTYNKVYNL